MSKEPKKILIFSLSYYPLNIGGAEIAIKEITDRIDTKDIEFDLICLRFDSSLTKFERIGNVNVHRIGFTKDNTKSADLVKLPMYLNKVFFPVTAFLKAISLHRKRKYDVMWSMMSYMGFPALFFKLFYNAKMPFLLTLQEGDSISHITKRYRIRSVGFLYKMIFKKANFVQVISRYLADFARQMGYVGDIEIVPNAVDAKYFSAQFSKTDLDNLKQKLGKGSDDKFIITTSRLVHKNAVDDIISSLEFLPANFKLFILGIGPDEEKLKNLVDVKGLKDRVSFLGHIDNSDLPKYLKVSDVFVRPSRSEGFGNSFIEAMARGLPVVATQEGGIADFLFDSVKNKNMKPTGFAVEVNNPKDVASGIMRSLKNKEFTGSVIINARNMVFEKYDWDIIANDMKTKVFDRVLEIR